MRFRRTLAAVALALGAGPAFAEPKAIPSAPAAVTKPTPESIAELKAFQDHTKAILDKVIPATVCLQVGGASGSGVIVSKDGLILTAGHVSGDPDKTISIIFPDGKRVKGKTLGLERGKDSGMVKITDAGEWPYVEVAPSKDVRVGQWCVSTGHPGGYKSGRSPVVRVGRIVSANDLVIQTDCTLVGGDSGGPLFDMQGRVIGIHSRIGLPITFNMHVPTDVYKNTWEQLVRGDRIGENPHNVYLGVRADENVRNACQLGAITPDSPADKAGLKVGDVIAKFNGKEVKTYAEMIGLLTGRKPGDEVPVVVKRGSELKELKVVLGKRKD
ncbi:MAG TPA: trypsin-like peptidase domain-containing protein [Gemmataceae bacterium]|jgi:serine protease Do|nr:trypsin-like peptidase domain-containing protein [Gemmataceae bacterium]